MHQQGAVLGHVFLCSAVTEGPKVQPQTTLHLLMLDVILVTSGWSKRYLRAKQNHYRCHGRTLTAPAEILCRPHLIQESGRPAPSLHRRIVCQQCQEPPDVSGSFSFQTAGEPTKCASIFRRRRWEMARGSPAVGEKTGPGGGETCHRLK